MLCKEHVVMTREEYTRKLSLPNLRECHLISLEGREKTTKTPREHPHVGPVFES
jgi:hypothetical protein